MTVRTSNVPKSRYLSIACLTLAGVGAASLAAKLILGIFRSTDECRTAITFALDLLIWAALVSSVLAFLLGVVALVLRSGRISRTLAGTGLAMLVGVLVFFPNVGTYVCGSSTP